MVPERRPTIKDVARLAGVSPGTASRVLSGSDYPVHPATRERVLRAAAELDYYPSAVGRALVRGRTGVIGAIVHDITDPFFNVVARGIEDVAGEHDYLVVVCNADRRPEKLLSYLTKLRGYHVDGVILVGAELQVPEYQAQCERYLAQLERGGVPVITVGRYSRPGPGLYYDNLGGISLLVRHLVDLGHRRIAHIAGSPNSRATTERLAGYLAALASCGLEIDSSLVVYGDYSRQSGSRAAETLMALPKPPTAIVAATDEMAAGCVRALRQQGVRVPEDVSVTGFN
ncbi:MAG TPA: LacI family DNA-binding transcriptional regulator, partial [Chloroflexota bacterium]